MTAGERIRICYKAGALKRYFRDAVIYFAGIPVPHIE
jgi:hypothetical protein